MTREEAINEIKNMAKFNYTLAPMEVFDMAIKALEQMPCEDATNGDVIKLLFPQLDFIGVFETTERRIMVKFDEKDDTHDFVLNWWNAPYKAESGE